MSDIRLCQGIMKNRVKTEQCKFSCTSDFTVVSIYRYPHNFCKYEMLPIHCCIIIPLMCGLSCGLQKLYMHKHGSRNRLEQERKQHFPAIPVYRARTICAHTACAAPTLCARERQTPTYASTCRVGLSCSYCCKNFILWISSWLRTIPLRAVCFKANLYSLLHNIYMYAYT